MRRLLTVLQISLLVFMMMLVSESVFPTYAAEDTSKETDVETLAPASSGSEASASTSSDTEASSSNSETSSGLGTSSAASFASDTSTPASAEVSSSAASSDAVSSETSSADKLVNLKLKPVGGEVSKKLIRVKKSGRLGSLPVPTRKGYRFLGWYTKKNGGKKVTKRTKTASLQKRIVYAHWEPKTYKIRYVYNGGKAVSGQKNPKRYTTLDQIKLKAPSKDGYSFKGWYTTKSFADGTKKKVIRKGSVGTITLYAKYEPIKYKIRFKANDTIETVPKTMVCVYGKRYTLPGSTEITFDHWNTDPSGNGKSYKAGKMVKNLASVEGQTVDLYAYAFSGKNNIEKLTKYLVRIGFSKAAAAGIAGNLMFESGGGASDITLNAVEWSTGRGVGMVQWTNTPGSPRRTNFVRFCASRGKPWPNKDLKVQIDFLMAELEGKYGKAWIFSPRMGYPSSYEMTLAKFKKCKDVEKATCAFCANFERPYYRNAHLDVRIRFAKIAMKYVS